MRILYISHSHPHKNDLTGNMGGMQRVSHQLLTALDERSDVSVHAELLTTTTKGGMLEFKHALHTVFFLVRLLVTLPRIVRRVAPDVIFFSSIVTAGLAMIYQKRLTVPMVTLTHGHDVVFKPTFYQKWVQAVLGRMSGVVSVSTATSLECIKRGLPSRRSKVIPNGFDLHYAQSLPKRLDAEQLVEIAMSGSIRKKHVLLTVGRLVKRKGHEWFIREVLPKIKSDVLYLIVGDGPERPRVLSAINSSPLNESICFLGKQSEDTLKAAYVVADLFIMPNIVVEGDMEGFGVVLLEANVAETPGIASDLQGIKDVIQQGKNGYRIEVNEPELFAAKIDDILSSELDELSVKAKAYVEDKFAWPVVVGQYVEYLKTIVSQPVRR